MAWGHGTTAADAEAYSGDFSGMPSAVEGINQGWIQQNPVPDVYKGIWGPGVKDLDFDLSRYYLEDDYKPPLPDEIVEQVHLRDRVYDFLTQGRMSGQLPWAPLGLTLFKEVLDSQEIPERGQISLVNRLVSFFKPDLIKIIQASLVVSEETGEANNA